MSGIGVTELNSVIAFYWMFFVTIRNDTKNIINIRNEFKNQNPFDWCWIKKFQNSINDDNFLKFQIIEWTNVFWNSNGMFDFVIDDVDAKSMYDDFMDFKTTWIRSGERNWLMIQDVIRYGWGDHSNCSEGAEWQR